MLNQAMVAIKEKIEEKRGVFNIQMEVRSDGCLMSLLCRIWDPGHMPVQCFSGERFYVSGNVYKGMIFFFSPLEKEEF